METTRLAYACRCPFCDKVIAVANDHRETFRAFVLTHLVKCSRAPGNVTYGAAAEIADGLVADAAAAG